ncbi:MAG: putative toxin-antitoxin system toxin component, PIN family [Candidatus Sumerlaeaceae bacterium]|nr:putative toxin-antitoxin system toxin component, PIN family [Candidatus Sumerlaeaceae bacterium]
MITAVLDTNVVVSSLLQPSGVPGMIVAQWKSGAFTVALSDLLLEEIADVLQRPVLRRTAKITLEQIAEFVQLLRETSILANEPLKIVPVVTKDPDDDIVLATAVATNADVIVSGDKHLTDLTKYKGIPIVTPREFLELLA